MMNDLLLTGLVVIAGVVAAFLFANLVLRRFWAASPAPETKRLCIHCRYYVKRPHAGLEQCWHPINLSYEDNTPAFIPSTQRDEFLGDCGPRGKYWQERT